MPHHRNFSYEEGPLHPSEQEHLTSNNNNNNNTYTSSHSNHDQAHEPYHDSPSPPQHSNNNNITPPSPSTPPHRYHPSAHPDSRFGQVTRPRNASFDSSKHRRSSSSRSLNYQDYKQASPPPPPPPPHRRKPVGQSSRGSPTGQDHRYSHPERLRSSFIAGMESFGEGQARRSMDRQDGTASDTRQIDQSTQPFPGFEALNARPSYVAADSTFSSTPSEPGYLPQRPAEAPRHLRQQGSYSSSTLPIAAGAATPGSVTPILPGSDGSGQSFAMGDYQSRQVAAGQSPYYHDSPYQNSSLNFAPQVGEADINPQNIADDGDDGFMPDPKRKSVLGMRGVSSNEAGASGAVGGAAAGGVLRALSTLGGRKQKAQVSGAAYDPVANSGNAEQGGAEKSEWLSRQTKGNNKMRWVVGLTIGAVVLLAVIGGIVGGVLGSRAAAKSGNDGGPLGNASGDVLNNAEDDLAANGIIDKNSGEIKKLMNNPDLHKVFPAMDYTPWGTQYPDCLTYPPSQNNITRNMAVLSQLTNTVRLYGTDCNQTEMVVESIRRLELDSMKVWLGVWIETNTTTNDRQLEQMYKILEDISDHSVFQGVIVGNEALYRAGNDKASSEQNLINILSEVKSNFTSLGYDHLPVATSDLGDNWTPQLVQVSDAVMANIHPFFAGVRVEEAAGWTWSFWQQKDIPLTQGTDKPQIISEAGWPSGGGNNCGSETAECAPGTGSVAGIDEMNTFMNDFVCQGLENGTDYFWFEAFDEPWKVSFNTPGKEWEDKWGLMDPGRKLKPGLKIPDCGGRTV